MKLLAATVGLLNDELNRVVPGTEELSQALKRFGVGVEEVRSAATGLNATVSEFRELGVSPVDVFQILGIASPEDLAAELAGIEDAMNSLASFEIFSGIDDLTFGLEDSTLAAERYSIAIDNIESSLDRLGFTAEEIMKIFTEFGLHATGVTEKVTKSFKELVEDWVKNLSKAQAAFDLFQAALVGIGNAIADAFLEEGVSMKQAIADMLKTIARMAIVYAVLFAAAGVAASTGFGGAVLAGSPGQFFAAAALFAAVGAAAGLASKALGGGSESRGRGGGRRNDFDPNKNRGTNIEITIEGSLIGSDPNELGRSISAWITKAQEDGAR